MGVMSINVDGGNAQAHSNFKYPEGDEALKERCATLAQECVDAFEGARYNQIPVLELSGVVYELESRGISVSVSIDGSVAEVVFE